MKELYRIQELIERVEKKNFSINEQSILGNAIDITTGALGGLYDSIKKGLSDGVPYLVDRTKGTKILKPIPFDGKLDTVCGSAAKTFKQYIDGRVESKTDIYNALIIIYNLVLGARDNKIVDGDGKGVPTWEVLETFTGALYYEIRGMQFTYDSLWEKYIFEDDIDDCAEGVSDYIKSNVDYNATIGDLGEDIKTFMVDFFLSGKETYYINDDRLSGDWNVSGIVPLIRQIDMSEYEEDDRVMSDFESNIKSDLPCYKTAKLVFMSTRNDGEINVAVRQEDRWITILYYDSNKVLTANVYRDTPDSDPVAITTNLSCGGGGTTGDIIKARGLNESFLIEQETDNIRYVNYGKLRLGFDIDTFNKLKAIHNGTTNNDTTTDTTTVKPEDTNQNDSGKDSEVTPSPDETSTNVEKLIQLLLSKGVSETFAKDIKYRSSMGAMSVGSLLGQTVTKEEYIKNEEDIYAEKFIEAIEKGITTFKRNETNHEIEGKEEEKVIDITTKISNPTPLELQKIEDVGDDAVSKTNNKLTFDKNRIKTVRVTSDESKVVYVAKDNITDLVSSIESELEKVFGGDWKLDKTKNKFMSSNKIFIFSKKEQ